MFSLRDKFVKAHPGIAEQLMSSDYDFLRTNEHLGDRIILLGLGGSHAYGTNVEGSDIDIRGITLNSREEILGLSSFEQFQNTATDTVVYSVQKVFPLLMACNPNIIEMLGLRDEDYAVLTPEGKMLLDNARLFLSKKAAGSFSGYANAQLRRIQTATARDRLPEADQKKFINHSIKNALTALDHTKGYSQYGSLNVSIQEEDIVIDLSFKGLPIGTFIDMMNATKQVKDEYRKGPGNRNNKKDDAHLNKHAMHLIRLYKMGIEILRDEKINTYREADHALLMDIRNGKYMNDEGLFVDAFYEMVDNLEKQLKEAVRTSKLPKEPDKKAIEELLMEIQKRSL